MTLSLATAAACAGRDAATIVDSGSTNTPGYTIDVRSDGSADVAMRGRPDAGQSAAKSFRIPQSAVTKFFADLEAARSAPAASEPCMKSASFGTSTHVHWQGWTSPDLDCPAGNPVTGALADDVAAIRTAAGL